jgi:hypothetical protein
MNIVFLVSKLSSVLVTLMQPFEPLKMYMVLLTDMLQRCVESVTVNYWCREKPLEHPHLVRWWLSVTKMNNAIADSVIIAEDCFAIRIVHVLLVLPLVKPKIPEHGITFLCDPLRCEVGLRVVSRLLLLMIATAVTMKIFNRCNNLPRDFDILMNSHKRFVVRMPIFYATKNWPRNWRWNRFEKYATKQIVFGPSALNAVFICTRRPNVMVCVIVASNNVTYAVAVCPKDRTFPKTIGTPMENEVVRDGTPILIG